MRNKQQRKSESDVHIDSVQIGRNNHNLNVGGKHTNAGGSNTAGVLLSTNETTKNPYFLTSLTSQQPVAKNVVFSPVIAVKTNNKSNNILIRNYIVE